MILFLVAIAAVLAGSLLITNGEHGDAEPALSSNDDQHFDTEENIVLGETPEVESEIPISEGSEAEEDGRLNQNIYIGVDVLTDEASGITHLRNSTLDVFEGTSADDVFLIGAGDVAFGSSGHDEFVVDGEIDLTDASVSTAAVVIKDFDPVLDQLIISIPSPPDSLLQSFPERPVFDGPVDLAYDNSSTRISINGAHVVTLENTVITDRSMIRVIYDYHSVAPTDFDRQYGYDRSFHRYN